MDYCVYYPETGEVKCSGSCLPDDIAYQLNSWPGHYVYPQAVPDDTHYMVAGEPRPRPQLECDERYLLNANGSDEVMFPLPAGSVIRYAGERFTTEGEAFAFTSDAPGVYVFDIRPPFPYVEKVVTIEATHAV